MRRIKSVGVVLVVMLCLLAACSDSGQQGGQTLSSRMPNMPSGDENPPNNPEKDVIKGTVNRTDAGLVVSTDGGDFLVTGKDLSAVEGKTVIVKGAVEDVPGRKTISISSVTVVE